MSTSIDAHVLNATLPVQGLVERGARVLWCLPERFAEHARACGAQVMPPLHPDPLRAEPSRWTSRGAADALVRVRSMYRDALAAPAGDQAAQLRALVHRHGVDVLVADSLMLAAGIAAEAEGIAWASLGDGPLQWPDPDLPPFGTGLPLLAGAPGRHRNRTVRHVVDSTVFAPALAELNLARGRHGLWPVADLLTAAVSRQLHLQGCASGFEYPSSRRPGFVHFVGALGPGPGFAPPLPEPLRRATRTQPLAVVTQGTLRPDATELALPAATALRREGFDVLVLGRGAVTVAERVPGTTGMAAVDLPDALSEADLLVTNGGWTTVTLALAAGVGVLQCGATEEKADIGARIRHTGVGASLRLTRPPHWWVARLARRVLDDPQRRQASARMAADFAVLDAREISARQIIALAGGRP
ncbi:glycosyltransferase [Luteococcus sp.]|uniref:glycosyltransferase n=1 Tax=Luteococcus sp. TaxID=1969402 RepID=UPI0037357D81